MRLSAEIVDLVGLYLGDYPGQVGTVCQVSVMQFEALVIGVRVLIDVVNSLGVEQGRPSFDAVNFVALFEQ